VAQAHTERPTERNQKEGGGISGDKGLPGEGLIRGGGAANLRIFSFQLRDGSQD